MKTIQKQVAEEATGIISRTNYNNFPKLYTKNEVLIKDKTHLLELLYRGLEVANTNAGAGDTDELFGLAGFQFKEYIQQSSSAGDWECIIYSPVDKLYYIAGQENRYPYFGFKYWINTDQSFNSMDEALNYNNNF